MLPNMNTEMSYVMLKQLRYSDRSRDRRKSDIYFPLILTLTYKSLLRMNLADLSLSRCLSGH